MIITFPRFCFWPPRTEKKKQKQKMAEMKLSIRREEGGPHSRTQAVGPFCNQTDGDGGGRKGGVYHNRYREREGKYEVEEEAWTVRSIKQRDGRVTCNHLNDRQTVRWRVRSHRTTFTAACTSSLQFIFKDSVLSVCFWKSYDSIRNK